MAIKDKSKGTPVRFYLTDEEKKEVDTILAEGGGKRATAAKIIFLQWIRSKKK